MGWLICQEPVHIGGADSSTRGNTNPIYRLSDRTPAIPGSSLRGALREHAEEEYGKDSEQVINWFGGKDEDISPGSISVGWGWPLWWPVHVLGYGNWWVSCPKWLNYCQTLLGENALTGINANSKQIYVTKPELDGKTVYLRWLKLPRVKHYSNCLPGPSDQIPCNRRIIVPDNSIHLFVDMGLVRQPRVKLKDLPDEDDDYANNKSETATNEKENQEEEENNLVQNLFSVEGFPPKAIFFITWKVRKKQEDHQIHKDWEDFLQREHHLGGLWSIGYGRILISKAQKTGV